MFIKGKIIEQEHEKIVDFTGIERIFNRNQQIAKNVRK